MLSQLKFNFMPILFESSLFNIKQVQTNKKEYLYVVAQT